MRTTMLPLLAITFAACAGPTPSPVGSQPAGDDLVSNLTARGITVKSAVEGKSGCPNLGLDDQAVYFNVTLADDPQSYQVYVIEWPDLQAFIDDGGPTGPGAQPVRVYRECITAYIGQHIRPVTEVESFPWRAYGPEWPDALRQALLDSLHAIGGR